MLYRLSDIKIKRMGTESWTRSFLYTYLIRWTTPPVFSMNVELIAQC